MSEKQYFVESLVVKVTFVDIVFIHYILLCFMAWLMKYCCIRSPHWFFNLCTIIK